MDITHIFAQDITPVMMAEMMESEEIIRKYASNEEADQHLEKMVEIFNASPFNVQMKQDGLEIVFSASGTVLFRYQAVLNRSVIYFKAMMLLSLEHGMAAEAAKLN